MANQPRHAWWSSILVAGGLLTATPVLAQSQGEVKVCYMSHPVQDASVAMFEKWSKANGVKLVKTPMSYAIFLPKITQMLTSGTYDQCDLIWHNDDWGQIWQKYMVPVDDVQGMDTTDKEALTPFINSEGKRTAVPMAHTAGTLFYRTDLISEADLPKTLDQMASLAERIQKEQKAKWGYVGGMSFNNTWFSLWWSMWNSGCDVFEPLHSRDNAQLAKAGWKPMLATPCHQQVVEYWWDAMKTRKISPEAMTSYGRNEANAIFMSGDALFTVADSTFWGDFNDPKKSKVAGKVGVAPFPVGQSQTKPISWMDIWGWAIPKSVAADRQVVIKKMLGAMMMDEEGQTKMWSDTGGPPPNTKIWANLEKNDPNWRSLKKALIDQQRVHSAYYFETWPAVHKAYSDVVIKALTGARADIPKVLQDGVALVHAAAAGRN